MTQPGISPSTDRPATADATLALLWERTRRQGDMPGFARAINAILASMRGEDEQEFSMAQTVLSDPVLTQKVLRLANSGMYSAFGQRVNTVSKAVLVLGTEAIGHLALGLKLIEELSRNRPDSAPAHVEMEKAVLAGMVAHQVAARAATRDPEEAVVCSILHSLGRMMVTFYLPEAWARLQAPGAGGGERSVLGLSLEELGRAAAEHWGCRATWSRACARSNPASAMPHSATTTGWRRWERCPRAAPTRCGTTTRLAPRACATWQAHSRRCWAWSLTPSSTRSTRPRPRRPPT
ncbi:HDOD domain-containing protein [Massilia sp. Dwa41.01b]|uniref:HDOD domain-containing protein n=1 Tax=Massilia sp. Dwa41.01b TaxID=2709302 RepID=UPI002805813D|nr:HDOD domain-containing protein [Massilia sp. Dwa41.01b]